MYSVKKHPFLQIIFWSIFSILCNAQKYVITRDIDVRKALTLQQTEYGIKGDASVGKIEVRMFDANLRGYYQRSYTTGGRQDKSFIFGYYLDYDSDNDFCEIGWETKGYFPWYCYIGFCQGDNSDYYIEIFSNDRKYGRTSIFEAAQYYFIQQVEIDDTTLESATLQKANVVIELEITGEVDLCSIKGIKLPGINLCIDDFISNISNQCDNIECDFINTPNQISSMTSIPKEKNITLLPINSKTFDIMSSKLNIYPNPTDGNFIIDFTLNGTRAVSFKILNINGEMLFEQKNKTFEKGSNKYAINLSKKLPPGLYFLKVDSNEFSKILKIIIE